MQHALGLLARVADAPALAVGADRAGRRKVKPFGSETGTTFKGYPPRPEGFNVEIR
jgi:hypothetical protein